MSEKNSDNKVKKGKKKIIIVVYAIVVAVIIAILIALIGNKKILKKITIDEGFNIDKIEESSIDLHEINEDINYISSKYSVDKAYTSDDIVEFNGKKGEFIMIRGSLDNVNIFKTTCQIDELQDIAEQLNNHIKEFTNQCKSYLSLKEDANPVKAVVYDDYNGKDPLTVTDSIYKYKGIYSMKFEKTENDKKKNYDVNFYMKDKKLVCEFAAIYSELIDN